MSIEVYRENLYAAQRELDIAQSVKDEFKRQGLIRWDTTKRGFLGWCVEGEKADVAYSAWQLARCNVEHWGNLLNAELGQIQKPDSRLPPERDDDLRLEAWQTGESP